ncbi:hypothetical protein BRADI_2g38726v3 [Brachypodium distachyon]|uniref:DUF1618 domain-containing protein n=1 Tax=Brachypodium distachyon TaxID=15368 RepID=A0A0Q3G8Y4_BRADI|nr:hypothetical protein BRADI_2g38726v3 [Brachypodium distachyon]
MIPETRRHPPPPDDDGGGDLDADSPKSFLLDHMPYTSRDRTNATAAHGVLRDPATDEPMAGIRASFFLARPPRVSCVLLDCANTRFTEEPLVVASHAGFVLLSVALRPRLDRIPQPNGVGNRLVDRHRRIGILPSSSSPDAGGGESGGYHIAALTMEATGEFELFVFSSEMRAWAVNKPFLPPDASFCRRGLADDDDNEFNFLVDKVIPVAAGGSVAFVDLFNGVLICDALNGGDRSELLHVPLPRTAPRRKPTICSQPLIPCDVAIDTVSVSGDSIILIKYIHLVYQLDTSPWHATTWVASFKAATSPWRRLHDWRKQYTLLDPAELSVAGAVSLAGLLPGDEDLNSEPAGGDLFVDRPLLSLHQDESSASSPRAVSRRSRGG